MCNYFLINELALGNRSLGYEFVTEKEVVEMTAKTVKDLPFVPEQFPRRIGVLSAEGSGWKHRRAAK